MLEVEPNGPAARAGIEARDVIVGIPGGEGVPPEDVRSAVEFQNQYRARRWQHSVKVEVVSGQQRRVVSLELE